MSEFPAFLRLNNIPLFACTTFYRSTQLWGTLGCFYPLAIVNNVATNIGVQLSFQDPALNSLGNTPRNGIARSNGDSIFYFWEAVIPFSLAAALFYLPSNSVRGLRSFPHSGQHFLFCFLFDSSHPNGCVVVVNILFNLSEPSISSSVKWAHWTRLSPRISNVIVLWIERRTSLIYWKNTGHLITLKLTFPNYTHSTDTYSRYGFKENTDWNSSARSINLIGRFQRARSQPSMEKIWIPWTLELAGPHRRNKFYISNHPPQ